jgi:hypothetical protein
MMDTKEYRTRQAEIARKVTQPVYVAPPKKSHIKRCEECRRVLTGEDIKSYRAEAGPGDPYGYPRICEACAEKPEKTVQVLEEPDKI